MTRAHAVGVKLTVVGFVLFAAGAMAGVLNQPGIGVPLVAAGIVGLVVGGVLVAVTHRLGVGRG